MARNTSIADAKKRAKALVAQVRQRVAQQEGTPAPDGVTDEDGTRTPEAQAKSRLARAQGHAASRTQRTQGRREGN